MPKKRKGKRSKRGWPPMFVMPGGLIRCKVGVPWHLECCDCGLDHVVWVSKVRKDTVTVALYRDDVATELARTKRPEVSL